MLNLRTSHVCGIIQITRDRGLDLGGIGWIINDPQIIEYNTAFNADCDVWERVSAKRPPWLLNYGRSPSAPAPFSPAWFVFTECSIALVGRDPEIEVLTRFLDAQVAFSWWALCGPAGIGKSRLAHELSLKFGGTWFCGFLNMDVSKDIRSELLGLTRPVLLIIDYAARHVDRVATLLTLCCGLAGQIPHKVRVLLLEREAGEQAE